MSKKEHTFSGKLWLVVIDKNIPVLQSFCNLIMKGYVTFTHLWWNSQKGGDCIMCEGFCAFFILIIFVKQLVKVKYVLSPCG